MTNNREYNSAFNLNKYHVRRAMAIEKLGGKCVQCFSTSNLEFDHIDPATKSFNLGRSWSVSLDIFLLELTKCQLLCKPCHKKKSDKEQTVDIHGTWGMYRNRKCRCPICRAFVSAYQKEYYRKRE